MQLDINKKKENAIYNLKKHENKKGSQNPPAGIWKLLAD